MVGYRLYQGNNLETLVGENASLFRRETPLGPAPLVVVSGSVVGRWLRRFLTERESVCMGLRTTLPGEGVQCLLQGISYEGKIPLLDLATMSVAVYKTLEQCLISDDPSGSSWMAPFRVYINGQGSQEGRARRSCDVACHIAKTLLTLGERSALEEKAWEENAKRGALPSSWQEGLWRALFHEGSVYLSFRSVCSLVEETRYVPPFSRIVLVGGAFLQGEVLTLVEILSTRLPVDHLLAIPAPLERDPRRGFTLLAKWEDVFANRDSYGDAGGNTTPFRVRKERKTLLSRLRRRFLVGEKEEKERETVPLSERSITVHSCVGRAREVEVVKNQILYLVERSPSLRLTDIVVTAPDIRRYIPHIQTIFPASHAKGGNDDGLPYTLMISPRRVSDYARAFAQLLTLPEGDFSRKDLFSLFDNPCYRTRRRLSQEERDRFLFLCESLGIQEGFSSKIGEEGNPHGTWERGFLRILMGMALGEDDEERGPFPLASEELRETAGKLMEQVIPLYEEWANLTKDEREPGEWLSLLETLAERYLSPLHSYDVEDRHRIREEMAVLRHALERDALYAPFSGREIPFSLFRTLCQGRLEGIERASSEGGGVLCCHLASLQQTPYRAIFVLGMEESSFPKRREALTDFLGEEEDHLVAANKRLFWDLLLTAEDILTISYQGRDSSTGEELFPATVVSELLDTLERVFLPPEIPSEERERGNSFFLIKHPISPFDPLYFSGSPSYVCYQEGRATGAEVRRQNHKPSSFVIPSLHFAECWDGDVPFSLDLYGLLSFLSNPLRSYCEESLRIKLPQERLPEEEGQVSLGVPARRKKEFFDTFLLDQGQGDSRLFLTRCVKRGELACGALFEREWETFEKTKEGLLVSLTKIPLLQGTPPVRYELVEEMPMFPLLPAPEWSGEVFPPTRLRGVLPVLREEKRGILALLGYGGQWPEGVMVHAKAYLTSLLLSVVRGADHFCGLSSYRLSEGEFRKAVFPYREDAKERIRAILALYWENRKDPLPLYAELGERWGKGKHQGENLIGEIQGAWEEAMEESFFRFSALRRCPYRKALYGNVIPSFSRERIKAFWEFVYQPLLLSQERSPAR